MVKMGPKSLGDGRKTYARIKNGLTVINKIVFTSPEAMVELSREKIKPFFNIFKFIRV